MSTRIVSERADGVLTDRYSDGSARMLLEDAVRELLTAEGALRQAQQKFDLLAERCERQGQAALVAEARRGLADRRPA